MGVEVEEADETALHFEIEREVHGVGAAAAGFSVVIRSCPSDHRRSSAVGHVFTFKALNRSTQTLGRAAHSAAFRDEIDPLPSVTLLSPTL